MQATASSPPAAPKNTIAWAADLPALPAAVMDLLALVNADEVDIDELCARLSVDMALTAKLLRLANSSFYGARGEVTTVDAAVARVGLRMVKGVVTAAAVGSSIKPPDCPGFDFSAFWRHAVATATASQMLAFATGVDPSTAFTSGLLYRVGQLVMASQAPDHFAQVLAYRAALGGDTIEIERRLVGVDHAVIGARVAAHWRLPTVIVEALAQQDPPLLAGESPSLGQIAAAADRLIEALETGGDPAFAAPGPASAAWATAGALAGFWAPAATDAWRQAEAISSALSA
jgi:HD-like signal output (HDOD) protein